MNKVLVRSTVAALAIALATWVYFGPHLALRSLERAIDARDPVAISDHVDFPALRESLKASFISGLTADATKSEKVHPLAVLGVALASAMVSPMVDAMVSPEGLANILRGERAIPSKGKKQEGRPGEDLERSAGYETINRYVVNLKKRGEQQSIGIVFTREGLIFWKLSAVRVPQ